jgi:hypothetical protein
MNDHYHRERDKELEERMLNGEKRRKPKLNRKLEITFLVVLAFVVGSIIYLV